MGSELRYDVSLAEYTSWRVGGKVRCLYRPEDKEDLLAFLASLPENEPILWIGHGSNLLVRDGGFPGTVILLRGALDEIELITPLRIRVQAGVNCAKLARVAARAGLTGGEFLAGIPGTFGGALALNAGAFGSETWNLVHSVETVDRTGTIRRRLPTEFNIGYREVKGPVEEWFVEALLELTLDSVDAIEHRIQNFLSTRAATQPIGQPSAGSTFRNPPGDFAGRLIELTGLKGLRCGGAEVSPKHANFIVNSNNATATDIEMLIDRIQNEVERNFGVRLIPEVKIVGVGR
jgi:UDP-N-acetylmuramate dehydrogenase